MKIFKKIIKKILYKIYDLSYNDLELEIETQKNLKKMYRMEINKIKK